MIVLGIDINRYISDRKVCAFDLKIQERTSTQNLSSSSFKNPSSHCPSSLTVASSCCSFQKMVLEGFRTYIDESIQTLLLYFIYISRNLESGPCSERRHKTIKRYSATTGTNRSFTKTLFYVLFLGWLRYFFFFSFFFLPQYFPLLICLYMYGVRIILRQFP
eukprot:Rmarinus@m.21487